MENKADFVITDGSVEYKHSKPRAEYETVAPLVRLNFTIAEGSDPDIVVRKVMDMAVRHVEGVLMGGAIVLGTVPTGTLGKDVPEALEKPRRGRPPTKSLDKAVELDAAAIDEPEMVGFSPTAEQDAEPEITLTLKGDVQPLAQKVSAHLAKVDGNINKLRAVIKECGGNSLLNIPQDNWPTFIMKAKELLP